MINADRYILTGRGISRDRINDAVLKLTAFAPTMLLGPIKCAMRLAS